MPYTAIESLKEFQARIVTRQRQGDDATPEGLFLEFKKEPGHLKPKQDRDEASRELARDITQFMNSDGGCLIFGVKEAKAPDGRTVAGATVGVPEPANAVMWMEEAFSNYVYPAVSRPPIAQIPVNERDTVLVVNIDPEPSLVAVWNRQRDKEKHGMEFLYRTNHGKQWMTPDEVAMRMNDRHRATRLSLTKLLQESTEYSETEGTPVTLLHHVTRASSYCGVQYWEDQARILRLGTHDFTLQLTETGSTSPTLRQGEITIAYDWTVTYWWDRRRAGNQHFNRPAIQVHAGFSFDTGGKLRIDHPPSR